MRIYLTGKHLKFHFSLFRMNLFFLNLFLNNFLHKFTIVITHLFDFLIKFSNLVSPLNRRNLIIFSNSNIMHLFTQKFHSIWIHFGKHKYQNNWRKKPYDNSSITFQAVNIYTWCKILKSLYRCNCKMRRVFILISLYPWIYLIVNKKIVFNSDRNLSCILMLLLFFKPFCQKRCIIIHGIICIYYFTIII